MKKEEVFKIGDKLFVEFSGQYAETPDSELGPRVILTILEDGRYCSTQLNGSDIKHICKLFQKMLAD